MLDVWQPHAVHLLGLGGKTLTSRAVAVTRDTLASMAWFEGDADSALTLYQEALRVRMAVYGDMPHPETADRFGGVPARCVCGCVCGYHVVTSNMGDPFPPPISPPFHLHAVLYNNHTPHPLSVPRPVIPFIPLPAAAV